MLAIIQCTELHIHLIEQVVELLYEQNTKEQNSIESWRKSECCWLFDHVKWHLAGVNTVNHKERLKNYSYP